MKRELQQELVDTSELTFALISSCTVHFYIKTIHIYVRYNVDCKTIVNSSTTIQPQEKPAQCRMDGSTYTKIDKQRMCVSCLNCVDVQ